MSTIDLTDRYHRPRYIDGDLRGWWLDRDVYPVKAVIVHHSAGFYGKEPRDGVDEMIQLDALAADHFNRFGIGPGYHYAAFPSGNLYAIGKYGMHRAHTKGRNPETGQRWNVDAIGVVAMGNYEADEPTDDLLDAVRMALAEVRGIELAYDREEPAVHFHGIVPTVNSFGVPFAQDTMCPGRHLLSDLRDLNRLGPPSEADIETAVDNARREGWNDGARAGYQAALSDLEDAIVEFRGDSGLVVARQNLPSYPGSP